MLKLVNLQRLLFEELEYCEELVGKVELLLGFGPVVKRIRSLGHALLGSLGPQHLCNLVEIFALDHQFRPQLALLLRPRRPFVALLLLLRLVLSWCLLDSIFILTSACFGLIEEVLEDFKQLLVDMERAWLLILVVIHKQGLNSLLALGLSLVFHQVSYRRVVLALLYELDPGSVLGWRPGRGRSLFRLSPGWLLLFLLQVFVLPMQQVLLNSTCCIGDRLWQALVRRLAFLV